MVKVSVSNGVTCLVLVGDGSLFTCPGESQSAGVLLQLHTYHSHYLSEPPFSSSLKWNPDA